MAFSYSFSFSPELIGTVMAAETRLIMILVVLIEWDSDANEQSLVH